MKRTETEKESVRKGEERSKNKVSEAKNMVNDPFSRGASVSYTFRCVVVSCECIFSSIEMNGYEA